MHMNKKEQLKNINRIIDALVFTMFVLVCTSLSDMIVEMFPTLKMMKPLIMLLPLALFQWVALNKSIKLSKETD